MDKNLYILIMAAGSGRRMGSSTPKQFLEVGGKPILRHTIEKFISACPDARIVTVLSPDMVEHWDNYCLASNFHQPQMIVEGGMTRYHSVKNALARIPSDAIVAVHDSVRPFVSVELIRKMREKMASCRALIPVVPMTDTLKVLGRDGNGELFEIAGRQVDRSEIFGAQTPQFFHAADLKEAYDGAYQTSLTDDASVIRRKNIPLSFIEGERFNIKITTPQDLLLAEKLVLL